MRKIIASIYIILLVITIFALQIYLIDSRTLFGIKPNLILISVITVSLWYGLYVGSTYAVLVGIITDMLFGNTTGLFTISYGLTGVLIGFFNSNYRKENKASLIYVTMLGVCIFELSQYLNYIVLTSSLASIVHLIKQILISSLLNIIIAYILYNVLYKISEFVNKEFVNEASF